MVRKSNHKNSVEKFVSKSIVVKKTIVYPIDRSIANDGEEVTDPN